MCNICTDRRAAARRSRLFLRVGEPALQRFCRGFRSLHGCRPRTPVLHLDRHSLGVISAVHQGSRLDYTLRVVSLSGLSLPSFWLGLLILMASVSLFGSMPIYNPNPKTWTEAFAIYAVPAMASAFAARR